LSEPAAPPPDAHHLDEHDRDDRDDRDDTVNFARVLRVAVIVAALVSAFAAAHGLVTTAGHYLKEIPAGTITRVDAARGGYRITLDGGGAAAHVPVDILETTGRRIALRPGMPVAKPLGSLTYSIAGEPRGGLLWALRQWLLPARVTLPLVVYFVLSWLLVFRATEHRRHIAVEALIVPLVRWLAILAGMLLVMALLSGCAAVLFRMSG